MLVTLGVLALAVTSALFILTWDREHFIVTRWSLVLVWLGELYLLLRYIKQTNRDLMLFFESVKFEDDTIHIGSKSRPDLRGIYQELNRINTQLGKKRQALETEHLYFQQTVRHAATGLLSFDDNGHIELINGATLSIFEVDALRNVKDLNKKEVGLGDRILNLEPGTPQTIAIGKSEEQIDISVHAVGLKMDNRVVKIVSVQDISAELESGELQAWQKLIRVMSHEIINSVSPITLLSSSLVKKFEAHSDPEKAQISKKELSTYIEGLYAINRRSAGLSRFVESYKSVMKIPEITLTRVEARTIIQNIIPILEQLLGGSEIAIDIDIDESTPSFECDESLIEQILINLVKNAQSALEETKNPSITISACHDENSVIISVTDNGHGIDSDHFENIFVPFYTTKQNGSGIGLSISRQIMKLHNGGIKATSHSGKTTFSLTFKK